MKKLKRTLIFNKFPYYATASRLANRASALEERVSETKEFPKPSKAKKKALFVAKVVAKVLYRNASSVLVTTICLIAAYFQKKTQLKNLFSVRKRNYVFTTSVVDI